MMKERRFGVNRVTSDAKERFTTSYYAMRACAILQQHFACAGYLTSNSINLSTKRIELTVHFEGQPYPAAPKGLSYTQRETTSHQYWSDLEGRQVRVRCMTYYFKY